MLQECGMSKTMMSCPASADMVHSSNFTRWTIALSSCGATMQIPLSENELRVKQTTSDLHDGRQNMRKRRTISVSLPSQFKGNAGHVGFATSRHQNSSPSTSKEIRNQQSFIWHRDPGNFIKARRWQRQDLEQVDVNPNFPI